MKRTATSVIANVIDHMTIIDDDLCLEGIKARERMGEGSENTMRWFLKFTQRDISKLSEGDWLNLQYEISIIGSPYDDFILNVTAGYECRKADDPLGHLPTVKKAEYLQELTQKSIENIVQGKDVQLPPLRLSFRMAFTSFPKSSNIENVWLLIADSDEPSGFFIHGLATHLAIYASRLKQCPECQTIFLSDRKNQNYCSLSCQNRVATRRYRKSHGLITGKPRGRPPGTGKKKEKLSTAKGGSSHGKTKRKG